MINNKKHHPPTAAGLREAFRRIPREQRGAHQDFSIRVWRGLSWLERAEGAAVLDMRFIALWIAFNSIYGHLESDGRKPEDRQSWQYFLTEIVKRDTEDRLGAIVRDGRDDILHLAYNKFLSRHFWNGAGDWEARQERAQQQAMVNFRGGYTLPIITELFERLYLLRVQVFHGAATSGSAYNRACMQRAAGILGRVVPAMIRIMIDAGPETDWGAVCFPVIRE